MTQIELPCLFMRAGTSRGPFFNAADLPNDTAARDAVLLAALGCSEDGRQLDGIGGGDSLTSKVAIVGRSTAADGDVDYQFVQVATDGSYVDATPACGNMLSGVGPFAIETGLVAAEDGATTVRIRDLNSGGIVEAVVETPDRRVTYAGDAVIDGVAGTAAPIRLNFTNIVGAKTGTLFPTGQAQDEIDGITVTCIDAATPMVLINATDLGLAGDETPAALNANLDLFARVERIRRAAGWRMGLGDVSNSVLPKVALLSAPRAGGAITSRYLTPFTAHKAHAVTGAICVAVASAAPGTVAADIADLPADADFGIEHPSGKVGIQLNYTIENGRIQVRTAGVTRTARLLMRGAVAVPADVVSAPAQADSAIVSLAA